jgi:hypothetical protein
VSQLPVAYGIDDQAFPSEIGGQLAYPFRQLALEQRR